MHYRKFYENRLNVKLPRIFHVHHIDFNRENNDIVNLVALPAGLHVNYHRSIEVLERNFATQLTGYIHGGMGFNSYQLSEVTKAVELYNKCCQWVDFRDYTLGFFPSNIHNLSYSKI